MFSDIWQKIKELVRKVLPKKSIESVLSVAPTMSDRMADAIQLWSDMYEGHSPWLKEPVKGVDPERIVSLGLPALIASEKARMATLEMKSEVTAPTEPVDVASEDNVKSNLTNNDEKVIGGNPSFVEDEMETPEGEVQPSKAFSQRTELVPKGPTERAEFLNKQYKKLLKQIRRQTEYGIAKGGLVIKPYIVIYDNKSLSNSENSQSNETVDKNNTETDKNANNNTTKQNTNRLSYDKNLDNAEIEFDFIQADRFFPLGFDANGKVVEAAFVQTKVDKAKERVYLRLEYHKLEKHTVTVQNFAFESDDMSLANSNNIKSASNLGKQISLKEVPEWANLQPKTVIEDIDQLLFAYFRMPEANTIDPYSPLGVSGYSRAVQLIKDADMQYSRLLWEFEGGEMAIDVDRDALKLVQDANGQDITDLPTKQQRLFRKIDLNTEDTYNVFAPPLRDSSLLNGLNAIFTRIEDVTGLSRGTISNSTEIYGKEARTATELKILKQRSYATNADIQQALQDALEDTVRIMDVYCTLYDVVPDGEYEVSFEWDDSIIIDSESELTKRLTLMQNGLASKLETRMWYFGETENQARAALQQVDIESTQAMMQNVQAEMLMGQVGGNEEDESTPNTKQAGNTTSAKKSTGQQGDSLENPDKSKLADKIKK